MMDQYRGVELGDLSPHVYAIADAAYRQMRKTGKGQSILVRRARASLGWDVGRRCVPWAEWGPPGWRAEWGRWRAGTCPARNCAPTSLWGPPQVMAAPGIE